MTLHYLQLQLSLVCTALIRRTAATAAFATSNSCSAGCDAISNSNPSHSVRWHSCSGLKAGLRNNLEDKTALSNNFYALRHGQSMANVAKLIAASPSLATDNYGLSDVGEEQAMNAGKHLVAEFQTNAKPYEGIVLLSSDLLRAKQTAEIAAKAVLKAGIPLFNNSVVIEIRLRERGFGEWDGGSDEHYEDVWQDDAKDPTHTIKGVESVLSVMDRSTECVLEWDAKFHNHLIVCVAHGDVLQILQTSFSKIDGSLHRTLQHLETATLRRLVLATRE